MGYWLLNKQFETVDCISDYTSVIWKDVYRGHGDFEIYGVASVMLRYNFEHGFYILNDESDRAMIVENIELKTDAENGDFITVTGRSLESILFRRVICPRITHSKTMDSTKYAVIQEILNDSIIRPKNQLRKIHNFRIVESEDASLKNIKLEECDFYGDYVYDAIDTLCSEDDIGFRIRLDPSTTEFLFDIYKGIDHSYDQNENPYVVFSKKYENLLTSDNVSTSEEYKNAAYISIEDDEFTEKEFGYSGIERRETYMGSLDVSKTYVKDGEEKDRTDAEYEEALRQKAAEELKKTEVKDVLEAEIDPLTNFILWEDYGLGDIVQVENEYGYNSKVRITEIIYTDDENGHSVIPSFEKIEEKED